MPETLSETEACGLLARLFRGRGYAIARNVMFREYGVSFHIDGWDDKARVGFEFLTSEDDDHDDLSLGEYQTLMAAQQRGEISLFILDEVEPLSAKELAASAQAFLDEVDQARTARQKAAGRSRARAAAARAGTRGASRPGGSAKKPAAAKKALRKKATVKKRSAKKATPKKATPKKATPKKATRKKASLKKAVRRVASRRDR